MLSKYFVFFFSSRRRHTRYWRDWSSDVCSSDLKTISEAERLVPTSSLLVDIIFPVAVQRARLLLAQGKVEDRKSVVWGKSVDLGGRRIIKKKKKRIIMNVQTDINTVSLS